MGGLLVLEPRAWRVLDGELLVLELLGVSSVVETSNTFKVLHSIVDVLM